MTTEQEWPACPECGEPGLRRCQPSVGTVRDAGSVVGIVVKRAAPLTRKSRIKPKRAGKPRRVKAKCSVRGCKRPPIGDVPGTEHYCDLCKTHAKAECDRLFSLIVRSKGECWRCGGGMNLQAAHLVSRSYARTRYDQDNALCLDAKCHYWSHAHPLEWLEELEDELPGRMDEMRHRALHIAKPEYPAILADLRQRAASL